MATKKKATAYQNPSADAADAPLTPRRFVYCGMRLGSGSQRFVCLRLLAEDGTVESKEKWFEFKPARDKHIGGIYEGAEFSDSQARGLDQTRFVDKHKDLGMVALWTGHDSAAREQLAYEKFRKEQTKVPELEELMRPLRRVYEAAQRRYDMTTCAVLDRAVLKALHTPLRKYEEDRT